LSDENTERNQDVFHLEGGIPVFNTRLDKIESEQAEAKKRDEHYRDEQLKVNRRMMWFTALLVVCSAVTGAVSIYQTSVSKIAARAAADNAAAAKAQTEATKAEVEEMKKSGTDTNSLAKAAQAQAESSNRQAENMSTLAVNQRKALEAGIAATQLDQRPWVYATRFELSNEPEVGRKFWITAYLGNNGKTPALEVRVATQVLWWHAEPPPSDFDQLKATISNLIPPSISGERRE